MDWRELSQLTGRSTGKAGQHGLQSVGQHAHGDRGQDHAHDAGDDAHGGAERWGTVCSLIATARLNDIEPCAYLKNVLERMTHDHPMSRLDDLLPWNWSPTSVNP